MLCCAREWASTMQRLHDQEVLPILVLVENLTSAISIADMPRAQTSTCSS